MCRLYRWTWYGVSVRTCGVVVATMLIYLPSFPLGTCLNRANDRRWAIQQKRSTEARMPSQWSRIRSAGRLRDAASLSGAPRTGAVFTWVAECQFPNPDGELWTHMVKYITGLYPSFKSFRRELSRYRLGDAHTPQMYLTSYPSPSSAGCRGVMVTMAAPYDVVPSRPTTVAEVTDSERQVSP